MVTISYKEYTAEILLYGGELARLTKNGHNILWGRDNKVWGSSAPLLFPICGRLRDNTYFHNDKQYLLSPHGFAKTMTFKVREQKENEVTLYIEDTAETRAVYPFRFDFEVKYILGSGGLEVHFCVTNNSNEPLPFSVGGHWGFVLEESIENYTVEFDQNVCLKREILDGAFLSGEQAPLPCKDNTLLLSYQICDNDTYVIKNAPRTCTLKHHGTTVIRLEYPDTPHLLIWTLPEARFVCIEPWNGLPDGKTPGEIKHKDSVIFINPSGQHTITHTLLF